MRGAKNAAATAGLRPPTPSPPGSRLEPATLQRMAAPTPTDAIDLEAAARALGVELAPALAALRALLADVDRVVDDASAPLGLPCHRGCSMCCHQSVFLTPLEFFYAWDWAQRHLDGARRAAMVRRGLALYHHHRATIDALGQRGGDGQQASHDALARGLRFRCPLLGDDDACSVHPARELFARLFGGSFLDGGEIYGCQLVALHLAGRPAALPRARAQARRIADLPLTSMRQVYPWYLHLFYGGADGGGWPMAP